MNLNKRYLLFLVFAAILISVSAYQYWIAKFIAEAEFTNVGTIAKLEDINKNLIECNNCEIIIINNTYVSKQIGSSEKILFIGQWYLNANNKNISVDIWRKRYFNYTSTLVGIGEWRNCSWTFENATGVTLKYNNTPLCVLTSDNGYTNYTFELSGEKRIIVFVWIPSVMEQVNLTIGSSVYVVSNI